MRNSPGALQVWLGRPDRARQKRQKKAETSVDVNPDHQFAYNFNIIAHEIGHGLIFALAGIPFEDAWTADYRGFQDRQRFGRIAVQYAFQNSG